jgi:phosphatidylserine/phosphatidylglycerophosphate/cardiolipin synthase-like enzyme
VIAGAQKPLHLEDEEMYDATAENALIAAVRRGVDVEVILPPSDTEDSAFQGKDVQRLIAGGVHVRYLGAP